MRAKKLIVYAGVLVGIAAAGSSYATITQAIDPGVVGFAVDGTVGPSATPATAYFSGSIFRSTGTGVIDPFLREQDNGGKGSEEGMNTSEVKNYLDNKQPVDGYTRDLPLVNLQVVHNPLPGVTGDFYEFFLDVNQNMNTGDPNGYISLKDLKIWISPLQPDEAGLDALRTTTGTVWDMNSGYDIQVPAGTGSGSGDLSVLVPVPASHAGDYVYLYALFDAPAFGPNDGFEEWRARLGIPLPPVPDSATTMMLLGSALVGVEWLRRKLRA